MDRHHLRPYQVRTVEEIVARERLIAVLDMGAGKTISTLTAFCDLQDTGKVNRLWVIAPKRVAMTVWAREARDWSHTRDLLVVNLTGLTPKKREAALARDADVYVLSYELVDWVRDRVGVLPADDMLVLDEVTRVKSPKSTRGKAIRAMSERMRRRVGLTGSPRAKDRLDLFAQVLTVIGPGVWGGSFYKWRASRFMTTDWQGYTWEPRPGAERAIDEEFTAASFRIDTGRRSVAQTIVETVILPADALKAHEAALRAGVLALGGVDKALQSAADATNKARQVASGVVITEGRRRTIDGTEWLDAEVSVVHHEKQAALAELLDEAQEAGESVLVLYGYRAELELMRAVAPAGSIFLDDVPDRELEAVLARWDAGKVSMLVGHPAAMGHGLNLQRGGRRIIWWTLPWSLELYEQTNARLDRPGQTRTVYVHILEAAGTVDPLVRARLEGRDRAQNELKVMLELATKAGVSAE